mgnify:FL=1
MVLCKLKPGRNRNVLRLRNTFDPFAQMDLRMNRLFDDFFGESVTQLADYSPRTDVIEDEKNFEVTCELPGLDEKDISVSMTDGMLTIEGEKKSETEENEKGYHHIERSYGSFKRVIPFETDIDSENIEAKFNKGLLKVTLPKIAEEKPATKQIHIGKN